MDTDEEWCFYYAMIQWSLTQTDYDYWTNERFKVWKFQLLEVLK